MGIVALQQNIDDERAGEVTLELIGLRYVGDHSSVAPRGAINSQGKWPGTGALTQGNWNFGLVPDEGLGYLEARDDLEVVYADDREQFARALLSLNRLPQEVFGAGAAGELRDRVFDALGISENVAEHGTIIDQLREAAGTEGDAEEPGGDEDAGRESALMGHTRDELKEAVKEVREDTSEFSLNGAGKSDMAEFLAGRDDGVVNDALPEGGDDR